MSHRNNSEEMLLIKIGAAVQAYAKVEAENALLLQELLNISANQAYIIYFTVQNVRSRNEMFSGLIEAASGSRYKKYWTSACSFLYKLSLFRNAIVHWHHTYFIVGRIVPREGEAPATGQHGIYNPLPTRKSKTLRASDLDPFLADCDFIRAEIEGFRTAFRRSSDPTMHEKYAKPMSRQNLAVLQLPQTKVPKR